MSVPRARILELMKAQCQVFATTYNPEGKRMGNKILRQRLKGPALAAYYPRKLATIKDVKREFGPVLGTWDESEEDRFEYIEELKQRGKSAPKKKTTAPVPTPGKKR
ncbi:Mitochondrial 37S ribosomal protein S27 [Cladobotryum mycophilum]|uniref:Small ribosomal subunit protein mS33 n=1 Tax=Cladobotryum mycophilum TaxID=491253 RepID=A0ABR0SY74_9HYPO